jgi:hypothetical protein
MLKRPVKSSLSVVWKTATGKLPHSQMIYDASAAYAFFVAGFVSAVASFQVFLLITFHEYISFLTRDFQSDVAELSESSMLFRKSLNHGGLKISI